MTNNTSTEHNIVASTGGTDTLGEMPGVDFEIITAEEAAERNLMSARAEVTAREAQDEADVQFLASAAGFVLANKNGIRDLTLAQAVKAVKDRSDKGLHSLLYSSPTSVGYHRRTGLFYALPGDAPESITSPRDVQTKVKTPGLAAKDVDLILGASVDKASAWSALCAAADAATALRAAKDDAADEGDAGDAEDAPVKDAEHYLKSAMGAITKAIGLESSAWTPAAFLLAESIVDNLGGVLADAAARAAATAVLAEVAEDADAA